MKTTGGHISTKYFRLLLSALVVVLALFGVARYLRTERSPQFPDGVSVSVPAVLGNDTDESNGKTLNASEANRTLPEGVEPQAVAPELQALRVGEDDDAVVRAGGPAPSVQPAYQVYQAVDGDTFISISSRFGISIEYLTANNRGACAGIDAGQSIIIPSVDGFLHDVQFGETLADIAARYNVSVEQITGFAANQLQAGGEVLETRVVLVPGALPPDGQVWTC